MKPLAKVGMSVGPVVEAPAHILRGLQLRNVPHMSLARIRTCPKKKSVLYIRFIQLRCGRRAKIDTRE